MKACLLPYLGLVSTLLFAAVPASQSWSQQVLQPASSSLSSVDLPDAPLPESAMAAGPRRTEATPAAGTAGVQPEYPRRVPLDQCPFDRTGARECRVHWRHLMIEAAAYDTFQNAGNIYSGYWYRWETSHGKWMDRWFDSVLKWRWDSWPDNNPVMDDYVGHPMMGSITNYIWIQNDPKGMTLEFSNTAPYWKSRFRAMAFSNAFSLQWKFGPFGEAAIGHNGDHFFYDKGVLTNETGWVELVTTPVGGLGWTIAEDVIDKHLRRIEQKPHKPLTLLALSFLTPSRATANILRFRPPWYRDAYAVKADSFWSDPPGRPSTGTRSTGSRPAEEIAPGDVVASSARTAVGVERASVASAPEWPRYGGVHEFGAWWGFSVVSGQLWGSATSIRYMPIDLNYSYLLNPQSRRWAFRYDPELTALAMLDEPNPGGKDRYSQRTRSYGAGISPVGFRASFLPEHRLQPFLSTHGGLLGFESPVLALHASQFLYTVDFGGGLTIFRKARQSVAAGYRYQHLAAANGYSSTDANTFYFQVSRYRTKGYR
jgi:hypothetical protein